MFIKKGTKLKVVHNRKGTFTGIALEDFDSEKEEWYPIATVEFVGSVNGEFDGWKSGDEIPCRAEFCKLSLLSD